MYDFQKGLWDARLNFQWRDLRKIKSTGPSEKFWMKYFISFSLHEGRAECRGANTVRRRWGLHKEQYPETKINDFFGKISHLNSRFCEFGAPTIPKTTSCRFNRRGENTRPKITPARSFPFSVFAATNKSVNIHLINNSKLKSSIWSTETCFPARYAVFVFGILCAPKKETSAVPLPVCPSFGLNSSLTLPLWYI